MAGGVGGLRKKFNCLPALTFFNLSRPPTSYLRDSRKHKLISFDGVMEGVPAYFADMRGNNQI